MLRIVVAHPTGRQKCRVTRWQAPKYLAGGWRIVWPDVPEGTPLDEVFDVAATGRIPPAAHPGPNARIDQIVEWVEGDPDRAAYSIRIEEGRKTPRQTLIRRLAPIAASETDPHDGEKEDGL